MANSYTNPALLDRSRPRKVVFYGRVSTEHEAQLSALGNQMEWYEDIAKRFPNWTVVDKYIDEGITGTQAKKRPSFMKMIADSKTGKFDLIVTREVCRFARNTVDTLTHTRELRNRDIEVYFVDDNIWTLDGDGELRLSLMATLAQEESRKVSDRVKAGQAISRQNGTLYGCGNILGYDLKRNIGEDGKWNPSENTYVINPEQAETVRMIFNLYEKGYGEKKISSELCRLHRKSANGNIKWDASKIGRVLKNATYKGYICYNKSRNNNYLEQKRIKNHDIDTYTLVKGNFESIDSDIDKLNKRLENMIEMRADGEITKEEYAKSKGKIESELNNLNKRKASLDNGADSGTGLHLDLDKIKNELDRLTDLEKPDSSIVDSFISRITPVDNNRFEWIVRLSENKSAASVCCVGGRKNKATATIEGVSPLTYTYDFCIIDLRELKNTCRSGELHRQLLRTSNPRN